MFQHSDAGLIFIMFMLFGLSATTFSYMVSVFFSRAAIAATLGPLLFLGFYCASPFAHQCRCSRRGLKGKGEGA